MELPEGFSQETVILFDQRDLEKLVEATWGKSYDIGEALDRPYNGSYYEYDIDGNYDYYDDLDVEWNDIDGWYTLERVLTRLNQLDPKDRDNYYLDPHNILTALVEIGKLPKGKYILNYWW